MVMKSSAFAHSIITLRCFEASKHTMPHVRIMIHVHGC